MEKINNLDKPIKTNIYSIKYYIESPNGEELIFDNRQEIMKKLGCSLNFFTSYKYKGYKLIKKEKL